MRVRFEIYDILGRRVATLLDEPKEPGIYQVTWDAAGVPSGVYFARLAAGENYRTQKLMLLR